MSSCRLLRPLRQVSTAHRPVRVNTTRLFSSTALRSEHFLDANKEVVPSVVIVGLE